MDELLSEREREVVALIVTGLTNREIAQRLHLSPRTVQSHVRSAMRKTGTNGRVQLAVAALRRGIVPSQGDA
jgi:DNA-binding CsgD family transcriptional regulator